MAGADAFHNFTGGKVQSLRFTVAETDPESLPHTTPESTNKAVVADEEANAASPE